MRRLRLADMTQQQIFDAVLARARDGRGKCHSGGSCVYRGPKGNACFVGALIGDDEYSTNMEGTAICGLEGIGYDVGDHAGLLAKLQDTHDRDEPEQWESALARVANEYSLVYTPRQD